MLQSSIKVIGVESDTEHEMTYPSDSYDERLVVELEDEIQKIPVTGIRREAYEFFGEVPEMMDADVVHTDGFDLFAECHLEDGSVVEVAPNRDSATSNYSQVLSHIEDGDPPEEVGHKIVWRRDD